VRPHLRDGCTFIPCFRNWGATGGLDGDHLWTLGPDPAQLLHFIKCLPHSNKPDTSSCRIDDGIRHFPSKLFDDLIAHRLLAFEPIGLLQCRDVKPVFLLFTFTYDAGTVADQSWYEVDLCSIALAFDSSAEGHVLRHEDVSFDARSGRIGREGAGCVSCGRNRQFLESVVAGHGHSSR